MARKVLSRCSSANDQRVAVSTELVESFLRSKTAKNCSASTIASYRTDMKLFASHVHAIDLDLAQVQRRHVEEWLAGGLQAGLAAATVARRFRTLIQFYAWAHEEEEVPEKIGRAHV